MKLKEAKRFISKLKKTLDKVFSIYIRLKYADGKGYVNCYTCGRKLHWKEIQCGHFVSRAHLATRYEEKNCRPQCVGCNVFGNGRLVEFANKLDYEKKGAVSYLYRKAQEVIRYYPYEEMIEEYGQKVKELLKEKL